MRHISYIFCVSDVLKLQSIAEILKNLKKLKKNHHLKLVVSFPYAVMLQF